MTRKKKVKSRVTLGSTGASGSPEAPGSTVAPVPLELSEALASEAEIDWGLAFGHLTVLGPEAVGWLDLKVDGVYVDATLGGGGHSRLILAGLSEKGRLIALDEDPEPLSWAREGWGLGESRLELFQGNFGNLAEILEPGYSDGVDGILVDLGMNSRQLVKPGRGFSWTVDEPLDMRLNPLSELTAEEVVNCYSEKELADLIYNFGEERASRRLARAIVYTRQKKAVSTTGELAALVAKSLYRPGPPPKIHPATRTFMALRIEVNQELKVLAHFLKVAPNLLKPGGRLVVISFHSLEDRLVKEAFRSMGDDGKKVWQALHKKPQMAGSQELIVNHRSRSAKMRAGQAGPGAAERQAGPGAAESQAGPGAAESQAGPESPGKNL